MPPVTVERPLLAVTEPNTVTLPLLVTLNRFVPPLPDTFRSEAAVE